MSMSFEEFRRRVWEENRPEYTAKDVSIRIAKTGETVYGEDGSRYCRHPLKDSPITEFRVHPGLSALLCSQHWEPVGTLNPDTKKRFFWDEDLLVEFTNTEKPTVPDLTSIIKQGTRVIHNGTGKEYTISCFGFHTVDVRFSVVYQDEQRSWIRPVREFFDKFTFIEEQ